MNDNSRTYLNSWHGRSTLFCSSEPNASQHTSIKPTRTHVQYPVAARHANVTPNLWLVCPKSWLVGPASWPAKWLRVCALKGGRLWPWGDMRALTLLVPESFLCNPSLLLPLQVTLPSLARSGSSLPLSLPGVLHGAISGGSVVVRAREDVWMRSEKQYELQPRRISWSVLNPGRNY